MAEPLFVVRALARRGWDGPRHPVALERVLRTLRPRPALGAIVSLGTLVDAGTAVFLTLIVLEAGPRQNSDWHNTFVPASLALLAGKSPYSVESFYNPPWVVPFLVPFALLPGPVGGLLFRLALVAGFTVSAAALGASRLAVALVFLSSPVLASLVYANLDCVPLLGLLLPRPLGMLLLAVKPQIGLGVMVVWILQTWRRDAVPGVIQLCGPLLGLTALSMALFPPWPLQMAATPDLPWNLSLWPYTLPLGVALIWIALRRGKLGWALVASPLFSPYVAIHSSSGAVVGMSGSVRLAALAAAASWLPFGFTWVLSLLESS